MPAVPIIAAIASVPAAIGAAAATAVGVGTVSAVAATAIGSGIIAGGITAIQGGDISDVLESAVIGGATAFVGGTVANAVGNTVAAATGSQIAGAAVGSAAGTFATGGSGEQALASGLLSGVGAGINEAKISAADDYLSSFPSGLGEYTDIPADVSDFDVIAPPAPPTYDFPEVTPVNIDTRLAALNVAQAVAPSALTALLTQNAYEAAAQDDQGNYSYPIVPVPGDWRSPEYDMAFTPSAPIDFGSPDMLAGTQFAKQPAAATPSFYNLSDVINTLNFESVPFVQQQLQMPQQSFGVPDILQQFQTPNNMSMNDTIGNLDGTPATLNSIIAGIQSQYG